MTNTFAIEKKLTAILGYGRYPEAEMNASDID